MALQKVRKLPSDVFPRMARAAIAAMEGAGYVIVPREPTEAMKAVYGEFSREDWLQVLPEDVWQAMIDAALNSPPDGDRGGPPYEIPKVFR